MSCWIYCFSKRVNVPLSGEDEKQRQSDIIENVASCQIKSNEIKNDFQVL